MEKNALDQVHKDMQDFTKVCEENRAFTLMLRNPIIKHDKKRDILEKIFQGKVHPLTIRELQNQANECAAKPSSAAVTWDCPVGSFLGPTCWPRPP